MTIIYLLVGTAMGTLIGYLMGSRNVASLKKQCEMTNDQLSTTIKKTEILNEEKDLLSVNKTIAETKVKSLEEKLETQKKEIDDLHRQLTVEFENIANKVLKDNSNTFSRLSSENMRNMLDPFGKDILSFRNKIEEYYFNEGKERHTLQESIKDLVAANMRISEDANNLTKALKGESKTQGDWGEMILETILEKSGLVQGEHYEIQSFIEDENGEKIKGETGRRMQPDVIVNFPDDRRIIIDSKVSLTAYVGYIEAENDTIAQQKKKDLYISVKAHIDELSKKDYSKYMKNTPDFVMMFIPNEAAYYLTLQSDSNLWNYAYSNKVVLMTPTNLITALRLALDLWRRKSQEENIENIVKLAGLMYDKMAIFTESFKKIGQGVENISNAYDTAKKQLTSGRGNLLRQASQLKGMGINSKKNIALQSADDIEEEEE